jgi:hypothetical protein
VLPSSSWPGARRRWANPRATAFIVNENEHVDTLWYWVTGSGAR